MTDLIIGADEVAYGNVAGPMLVCAAACVQTDQRTMPVTDSKKYTSTRAMGAAIHGSRELVIAQTLVSVSPLQIVTRGYERARRLAFQAAITSVRRKLGVFASAILDGAELFGVTNARAIPKADAKFPIVGYASCVAKLSQVRLMHALEREYPMFSFGTHRGYATPKHIREMCDHGLIPGIHRIPVAAKMLKTKYGHTPKFFKEPSCV